ncbi:MAG: glycosyltransferase [Lachnospiraceae bacterium]|nr:glycosyltransferase [Lachnospiraceae bacterium]
MAEKKPRLTISLLSSGRSTTIERCLASLMPFKEKMDTEIIVVDTDPEHREGVHAVLEKYADQIIPFEWCDDFARARNVGVDAAAGEWFLFIDDDEWFIDADPVIDFLNSDDAEKCWWTNYRIRNYFDDAHKRYRDAWVSRMFRLDGKIRFRGRVHEFMSPARGNAVSIGGLTGHTGYIYHSKEERDAHARRNLVLLEELVKEEPTQVRWTYQMMQEYANFEDKKKELSLAKKGIKQMKGVRGYKFACMRGIFAANVIRLTREIDGWEKGYGEYRHLKGKKLVLGRVSSAWIEFEAALQSMHMGKYRNALRHGKRYLDAYDKYHDAPVECSEDYLSFLIDTFGSEIYHMMAAMQVYLGIRDGEWDGYDAFFSRLPWDEMKTYGLDRYELDILRDASAADYDERFAEIIGTFWKLPEARKVVKQEFVRMEAEGDENRWHIVQALDAASLTSAKPLDLLIMWEDHEERREKMPEYFTQLFRSANPFLVDPRLWKIGLRRGAVLDERIREIPFPRWCSLVDDFVGHADREALSEMVSLLDDIYMGFADERYDYFRVQAAQKLQEMDRQEEQKEQQLIQDEMQKLIDGLGRKVEELIAAGMTDEAEKVLAEIRKFSPE